MKENIKDKIIIQNILKFDNDNGSGVRIGFYLVNENSISNNKSYKGFTENACFYKDISLFDKLPVEIVGKTVDCTFKSIPSTRNPMKSISMIETIFYNGNNIRLLQSE